MFHFCSSLFSDLVTLFTAGFLGWAVRRESTALSDTIFEGRIARYHGAFTATNYDIRSKEDYYITRYFYCSTSSKVSVRYKYVYCGTETSDHCWLYLDDVLVDRSNGRLPGRLEWTDSLLRKKFKKKWGITSNLQLVIILFVFSITGSLSLYVATNLY